MRMPEPAPFGETFLEARARAIVDASLVNSPSCGWVESVFTWATHRFPVRRLPAAPPPVELLPRDFAMITPVSVDSDASNEVEVRLANALYSSRGRRADLGEGSGYSTSPREAFPPCRPRHCQCPRHLTIH